jgi:hypothetical protein
MYLCKRTHIEAPALKGAATTVFMLWLRAWLSVTLLFNPLTPNDPYRDRTATLTSTRCILYIYSTNIGTEYFKHGTYSPFFSFKMHFVS